MVFGKCKCVQQYTVTQVDSVNGKRKISTQPKFAVIVTPAGLLMIQYNLDHGLFTPTGMQCTPYFWYSYTDASFCMAMLASFPCSLNVKHLVHTIGRSRNFKVGGGGGGGGQNSLLKKGGGGGSNHLLRAICIGNKQNPRRGDPLDLGPPDCCTYVKTAWVWSCSNLHTWF